VLEALYAKEFALQKAFTQTPFTAHIFCTRNRFIKTGKIFIFLKEPLYQRCLTFMLEALYTKEFSQQQDFTLDPFCTEQFLHQQPLNYTTGFRTGTLYTKEFIKTCPPVNLRFWCCFFQWDTIWYQ